MEIQRLIARALRAAVDLKHWVSSPLRWTVTCFRLMVAAYRFDYGCLRGAGRCATEAGENGKLKTNPMKGMVAAVSVGL